MKDEKTKKALTRSNRPAPKPKTPRRLRPSIKKDRINPKDYLSLNLKLACEDCSHFSSQDTRCTLGFNPEPHLRKNVIKDFELSGKTAQCRFLEID